MNFVRRIFSGRTKLVLRGLLEDFSQVGVVALTFLIATQYWPIREHAVFALICIYAGVAFLGSARTIRSEKHRILTLVFFLAFLMWLLASTLWSPTTHMSIAYGLLSFLVGVSAVIQGLALKLQNFAWGIVLGVAFQIIHSIFVLAASLWGIPDQWGLYTNPSSMSLVVGIGLVALPFTLARFWPSWLIFGSGLTVFLLYLISLNILTSFVALLGALVVGSAVASLRRQPSGAKKVLAGLYFTAAVGGASIFWFFRGPILGLIGEDANLSERVPLWSLYFEAVLWRPILGSGWGSTVGWDFPLSPDRLSPVAEWFPAHNGYLDIALMLGFVGLGLFLGVLALLLSVSLRDASERAVNIRAMLIPVLLTYLMLNDVMATSFPKLLGIYLVGTLIGLVVAKPLAIHAKVELTAKV